MSALLLGRSRMEHNPQAGCQSTANERAYDENPQIGQCRATLKECGTDAASRVDGCSCIADAGQMDKHEREADGQTGEVVSSTIGL